VRLDLALVQRGLVRSRNQAARLIADGHVMVNSKVVTRPSSPVLDLDELSVENQPYVARSAEKLAYALDYFKIPVPENCLDIGASTGGFTQVLLERGAERVIALDVGTDQLAKELSADSRVIELSGFNIRDARPEDLPLARIDLVVVDLSFISLKLVAEKISDLAEGADFIFLIKPQFEVQRKDLNKHGVLVSDERRTLAIREVLLTLSGAGLQLMGLVKSPLAGSTGNIEFLAHLRHGIVADVDEFLEALG